MFYMLKNMGIEIMHTNFEIDQTIFSTLNASENFRLFLESLNLAQTLSNINQNKIQKIRSELP